MKRAPARNRSLLPQDHDRLDSPVLARRRLVSADYPRRSDPCRMRSILAGAVAAEHDKNLADIPLPPVVGERENCRDRGAGLIIVEAGAAYGRVTIGQRCWSGGTQGTRSRLPRARVVLRPGSNKWARQSRDFTNGSSHLWLARSHFTWARPKGERFSRKQSTCTRCRWYIISCPIRVL